MLSEAEWNLEVPIIAINSFPRNHKEIATTIETKSERINILARKMVTYTIRIGFIPAFSLDCPAENLRIANPSTSDLRQNYKYAGRSSDARRFGRLQGQSRS
jgi:hypothetical protein